MAYHPTLGKWIQRDPAGYVDGGNLYQYARSSPLASTDPSGLKSHLEAKGDDVTIVVRVNFYWDENVLGSPNGNTLETAKEKATFLAKSAQTWWNEMLSEYRLVQRRDGRLRCGEIKLRLEHEFNTIDSMELITWIPHSFNRVVPARINPWLTEGWIGKQSQFVGGEHPLLLYPGTKSSPTGVLKAAKNSWEDIPGKIAWIDVDESTLSHEVGHLIGLEDHYVPGTTEPADGWSPNLMSAQNRPGRSTKNVTAGQVRAALEVLNYGQLPAGNFGVARKDVDVNKRL